MFTGLYQHIIDEKNRIAIPAALRERIDEKKEGKGFYLTLGLEQSLFMFTPKGWQEVVGKIGGLPFTIKKARDFHRLFLANAYHCPGCDPQGRIIIPPRLKELARLGKEVVLIGLVNRIEIWDRTRWESFETESYRDYEKIAEDLFQLGYQPPQSGGGSFF